jgi:hypothetical protein
MALLIRRYTKSTEDFHRKLTLPVEDKRSGAGATRYGSGYRYFRAANIVPIEHFQLGGRAPAPIGLGRVLPFPKRRPYR